MLPSIGCKPSIFVPFGFSLVIQDIFHSWVCQFDSIMWQTKPTECDVLIPRWKLSSDSWMWRCVIVNLVNCVIDRQSVQKKKSKLYHSWPVSITCATSNRIEHFATAPSLPDQSTNHIFFPAENSIYSFTSVVLKSWRAEVFIHSIFPHSNTACRWWLDSFFSPSLPCLRAKCVCIKLIRMRQFQSTHQSPFHHRRRLCSDHTTCVQQIANFRLENCKSDPKRKSNWTAYAGFVHLDSRRAHCNVNFWFIYAIGSSATVSASSTSIQFAFKCGEKCLHVGVRFACAVVRPKSKWPQVLGKTGIRFNFDAENGGWREVGSIGGNQQNEINRFSMFAKIIFFFLLLRQSDCVKFGSSAVHRNKTENGINIFRLHFNDDGHRRQPTHIHIPRGTREYDSMPTWVSSKFSRFSNSNWCHTHFQRLVARSCRFLCVLDEMTLHA